MKTVSSGFRESVLFARERWNDGRQIMRRVHDEGAPGLRVVHAMSDLLDHVLVDLFRAAVADFSDDTDRKMALVLHGGCGRREVAPFSDVDLMLLHQGSAVEVLTQFARRISQDITDTGLQLGYSVRTPREACGMSLKDAAVFSSLTESRFLCGNMDLYASFLNRLQRLAQRRSTQVMKGIVNARQKEQHQFGETVNLLRPHVKKSRGGLRDLHLIRWLGFIRFGDSDIDQLCRRGYISRGDATLLQASAEFLLKIRNELHFHAGRANDLFTRDEQVRMAEKFGYRGDDAVLPVERLMQSYFGYSSQVRYISDHFVSSILSRRTLTSQVLSNLITRQVSENVVMGLSQIGFSSSAVTTIATDLQEILRMMQLACLHNKQVDYQTWQAIRDAMSRAGEMEITRPIAQQFMALLSNTERLPSALQVLHEMYALEKLIPDFSHARNLLQFNEYHKYTVDEHSLRAVRQATRLELQATVCGNVYRQIKEKNLLHLALLLHDLGKGYPEDHCDVGRRIAASVGKRLFLAGDETEDLKFLVQNHLVMSHLAFHRDINDETMVAEFASNVGSVRLLSMLYVLTCSDVQAVGPDVLTNWKYNLLTSLYQNACNVLTGFHSGGGPGSYRSLYDEITSQTDEPQSREWLNAAARNLPKNYCFQHEPREVAQQLLQLREMVGSDVHCWVRKCVGSDLLELCIGKRERRRSGLFYRLLGMLANEGLGVSSADIKSIGSSLVFYWFKFEDLEFEEPPQSRIEHLQKLASDLASGTNKQPPVFRQRWTAQDPLAQQLSRPKIEVKIDNQTVESATIIDVFAYRKLGVLYTISKQIYEIGLDVSYARISSYAQQLIAVFYVTDEQGSKIRNKNQLQVVKQEVYRATKNYLEPPQDGSTQEAP